MNDVQQRVQQALDRLLESRAERGMQVAVYRHGEPLVDAVAGVADPATGRPVTSDTPFFTSSVTRLARAWPRPWSTSSPSVEYSTTTRGSSSCGRSSARTARKAPPFATR
jgi:hypothetical protein